MNTFSEENQKRIKQLALNMRSKHKVMDWDVPPTYLIEREGLDYEEYDLTRSDIIQKLTRSVKGFFKRIIRAAIVIPERIVLIDTELHHAKKPFGQSHELGHHTIPEHKAIFYVCSEHDLNPQTRNEIEFEANIFAEELLFPSPLMRSIYEDYPLSMETILELAQLSNASIHSSAISYVKNSDKECCLLILKKDLDDQGNVGLRLKEQIASKPWWRKHRRLLRDDQFLPAQHNVSQVVFLGCAENVSKSTATVGEKTFTQHAFYNSYIVLVLLF